MDNIASLSRLRRGQEPELHQKPWDKTLVRTNKQSKAKRHKETGIRSKIGTQVEKQVRNKEQTKRQQKE